MDNFKIIYKILKILEQAMDYDNFDIEKISAEALKISENRWSVLMEILADEGYIKGILVSYNIVGERTVSVSNIRITLKGLEYLSENTFMKKAANIAKGIKDIPFVP